MLRQIEGPSSRASQPRSHHVIVQILESKSPQTSIRALWLEIESQAVEAVCGPERYCDRVEALCQTRAQPIASTTSTVANSSFFQIRAPFVIPALID